MIKIGIIGRQGSGKTKFANALASFFDANMTTVIHIDDLYDKEEMIEIKKHIFNPKTKTDDATKMQIYKEYSLKTIERLLDKELEIVKTPYVIIEGVDIALLNSFKQFEYKARIESFSVESRNEFLTKRLIEDNQDNPEKRIARMDAFTNLSGRENVPVPETIINYYDRTLEIYASIMCERIQHGIEQKRLPLQGPKSELKMCYGCDWMFADTSRFPCHKILFSTDFFFAKPNMHPHVGKHMVLMPRRCINHVGKLNEEELIDLQKLVKKVQRFYKYKIGNLPFIWVHNDPNKGFHNSTPHLHFHFMPYSLEVSQQNLQEMTLIKTNIFAEASRYNTQNSLVYMWDSKNNQYMTEKISAHYFLFEQLGKSENSRLLKYNTPEKAKQYIAETIDFFKDFNLRSAKNYQTNKD
jgi:diadenosine tetraphosphate (Ap4A) HIT family hydrolase/dephospho-CoA kinase